MKNKEVDQRTIMRRRATPELLGKIDDSKYVYATCRCPVDSRYGIKIPFDKLNGWEKRNGTCYIHCDNCGAEIMVHFKPMTTALHGLRANMAYIDEYVFPITNTESEEEE